MLALDAVVHAHLAHKLDEDLVPRGLCLYQLEPVKIEIIAQHPDKFRTICETKMLFDFHTLLTARGERELGLEGDRDVQLAQLGLEVGVDLEVEEGSRDGLLELVGLCLL